MAGGSVHFQPQNPAKSGDTRTYINARGKKVLAGWANCTAFVAAMGADFDDGVAITGTQVRVESNEPVPDSQSPGLNLRQIATVLKKHGIRVEVAAPIDFDDLDDLRRDGHAIGLQVGYEPILHSAFAGSKTFKDGHIVLWLPSGLVFDPLADGRTGLSTAPQALPRELLRRAAGSLALSGGRTVGLGRAYAAIFSHKHPVGSPPADPVATTLRFGAEPKGRGDYEVVVPIGLIRSSPAGVPGKDNVVGRRERGAHIRVFGTTSRGQMVDGSRVWRQVDRAGMRFMHSSVIDPAH
jgi:hypothetical protein